MNKLHIVLLISISLFACANQEQKSVKRRICIEKMSFASFDTTLYDHYAYRSDTLIQDLHVYYYKLGYACYCIHSINLRNGCIWNLSDTGFCQNVGLDPSMADDELIDGGEMFPVYEFFGAVDSMTVGVCVEPSRGPRASVEIYQEKGQVGYINNPNLTLRKVRFSNAPQFPPSLPEMPDIVE